MQINSFMTHACRLFLLLVILVTHGCGSPPTLDPGSSAPDFHLQAVRGDSFHLADHSGQVILLSFINTQAEAASDTTDPSRAQIVFLKSMQEQYGAQGLLVMIVDATRIATGSDPGTDQLINFTYDWQLDHVPALEDPDSMAAKSYSVTLTPTTFLIGSTGVIEQRWDGFASAAQLALSIEVLLGAPGHRQDSTAEVQ
jgi:peroxiredoxin